LLEGYYVQAGYFLHQPISWWPRPLELAARHAWFRPDSKIKEQSEIETSLALNWFFKGHKNKLTTEIKYFEFRNIDYRPADEWRFRVQWDISL
jgi:phosphate-selective porin OprO and OprP